MEQSDWLVLVIGPLATLLHNLYIYHISILVCNIAVYIFESCSILASPKGA